MLKQLIRRPIGVGMTLLVLIVLGLVAVFRLPVSLIPDIDAPGITVQISSPQMGAEQMDATVVSPLRQSLIQSPHLSSIMGESKDGVGTIRMTFDRAANMDFAYIEVNEKVDKAMSSLPRMERPRVLRMTGSDLPAFFINVTREVNGKGLSEEQFSELCDFVRNIIVKRFEQLDDVAMIDVSGLVSPEVVIIPQRSKLTGLGLSISDFENIVKSADINLSSLSIRDGEYRYNVKFKSFVSNADDIRNMWINVSGRILQIKDLAYVSVGNEEIVGESFSDGERAVVLAVIKQGQARMGDLKKSVSEQIELLHQEYPEIGFSITRDQTELLEYSVRNLMLSILLAVLLVCVIIFIFMKDLKSSFLVSIVIPISLAISFIPFYLFGVSINIISLSGLILGVGMMIDNTIVLIDNINARWSRDGDLEEAVIRGTTEVRGAMLSSFLTTCVVFVPLVFIKGIAGELFRDQAVAVTVVLAVSYLVTIVCVPVYYVTLYRNQNLSTKKVIIGEGRLSRMSMLYDKTASWFLKCRLSTLLLPLICFFVVAASLVVMEKRTLPELDYSEMILKIDWNEQIDVQQNTRRLMSISDRISGLSEHTAIMAGVQQFVVTDAGDQSLSEGSLYVKCANAADVQRIKAMIGGYLHDGYPMARVSFENSENVFELVFSDDESVLEAKLSGLSADAFHPDNLQRVVGSIKSMLPYAGICDVPLKTDVIYEADQRKMMLYGISPAQITTSVKNALRGNLLFDVIEGEHTIPVLMGYSGNDINTDNLLDGVFLTGSGGASIPASSLLRKRYRTALKTLESGPEGRCYVVDIDVAPKDVPAAINSVRSIIKENPEYDVSFGGSYFSSKEMVRQLVLILLVAIILLYLILACQFESLVQPLIILSEIIIDMAFCLGSLWLFGMNLNVMTLIGMIVTCGIVINDSILKVDTINQLCNEGLPMDEAIHVAGHRRLKAIVMTSFTTILAVLPMLWGDSMGAQLQRPMSLVVVIGMSIGTLVSIFYVPSLYKILCHKKE